MARTYKIRKFNNGKNKKGEFFVNYSLTLPTPLAEKLEADFGEDLAFEIKHTKDGILYIPTQVEESVPDDLPFKAQKSKPTPKKAAAKPATNGKKAPAKKPAAKAKDKPAVAKKAAPKKAPAKKAPAKPAAKAAPKRPAAAKRPTAAKPAGKARPTAAKKPATTGRKRPARAAA
jgi:hypothetical protein